VTQNHHIFFNDIGFHNHIVHHILTLYGLGASASQIEAHYKRNSEYQRPPYPVEERTVTDMAVPGHFQKYMAQEKYYHDYVIFFQKEMEAKGWEIVLNEYLFSGTEQADDLFTRLFACPLLSFPFFFIIFQELSWNPSLTDTHSYLSPLDPSWIRNRIPATHHHRRSTRPSCRAPPSGC
jgi:hypothetical protein